LGACGRGEERVWPVILLMSTCPYAWFSSAAYTESLFLFFCVSAVYAMRRGSLLRAALAGFAAGLTRPSGFWIALPLLWLATTAPVPDEVAPAPAPGSPRWKGRVAACLVALAPLAGVALFSGYLYLRFGDALAWMHGQ